MITFSHPYESPTLTIQLRNPELGNSDAGHQNLIFRKTMSGDLHTNISPYCSDRKTLIFRLLTTTMLDNLISFIKTVRDDEFRYVDYEGTAFKVKLPMSNIVISGDGRYAKLTQIDLEVIP
jgi:hypothetical protein